jgi:photosystem II stability/assembly factor-like uncharacterized protein
MKNHWFLLTILFCLFSVSASGQAWMKNLPAGKQENPAFQDIQEAFYQYWKDRPVEKHRGYKHFKRWEWFMNARVDESGRFPAETYWRTSLSAYRALQNSDAAAGWTSLGPSYTPEHIVSGYKGGIGRIDCITFHPTDANVIWIGSPSGGLWKTEDGGVTWTPFTDDLPSLGVSDIEIHPGNPDIMYLATGTRDTWFETFSVGILKSEDGGTTWQETGLNFDIVEQRAVNEILMDPDHPEVLVAATSIGIFKSADAGVTWASVIQGNFKDLAYKPGDFSVIYAATFGYYGGNARLYKSSDGGDTFIEVTGIGYPASSVNRIAIAVTPAAPDTVYLLCSRHPDSALQGVYKSVDSGETWTQTVSGDTINLLGWRYDGNDEQGQGWYDLSLAVSPSDPDRLYAAGPNIWKSTDGGQDWEINSYYYGTAVDYVHVDHHALAFNELTGVLYSGNDGGIYKSDAGDGSWDDLSDGLTITQIYRLGLAATDEGKALISPQDQGTIKLDNGLWNDIYLYEAGDGFFDYTNAERLYVGGYAGGLRRSENGGRSYVSIQPPGESLYSWLPPFIIHPSDPKTIYCAFSEVYKSTNRGNDWTPLTSNLSGGQNYNSLEIAPSNPDHIYAATFNNIWKTEDGGTEWRNIREGLPGGQMGDIAVSSANPDHVWVTYLRFNAENKVYRSRDGGRTWENITGSLPNLPVNCITHEASANNPVYAGTDVGVYYLNDDLEDWIPFSDGLPNVMIDELEIQYAARKIRAATYGRGLWESDLCSLSAAGLLFTGPGAGPDNPPEVHTYNVKFPGENAVRFSAYGTQKYGVNVAAAQLDGFGSGELLTGPGPGNRFGPQVRAFAWDGSPLGSGSGVNFMAYGTARRGVNVAGGDLDLDGFGEIITGAGPGAVFGPHVRAFNYDGTAVAPIHAVNFMAYGTRRWGVHVAAGDLDGDGRAEIITGAGPGAVFGPHVRAWQYDGTSVSRLEDVNFFAYGTNRFGVRVNCGDIEGDGMDEIVTGPGPGDTFSPHIRAFDVDGSAAVPIEAVSFFAYSGARFGATVCCGDVDRDGTDEIVTGPGPDPVMAARVRGWRFDGAGVSAIGAFDFIAYPEASVKHGVHTAVSIP